jgi:hypothetical protein
MDGKKFKHHGEQIAICDQNFSMHGEIVCHFGENNRHLQSHVAAFSSVAGDLQYLNLAGT